MPQRMGMSGVGRGRLARRGPAAVQAIHGALRPFREEHRHGVGRDEQRLADELRVGGVRASEHVVEHGRTIARVPDTEAQPPERIAHVRDHIAHAVVAGGAATLFEPYHARGEIELVVRHQHRLDRDLVVIRDAAHRVAAAVHVAHGLEQPQILSADARTCELRLVARLDAEGRLVAAGELVDDLEAGVVTGARVLDAGIAEPDDQLERLTCHVVDSRPKRRRPPGEPSLPRAAGVRCRARCGGYFLPPSFFPAAASFFGAAASFFSSPFFASPAAAGAPGAAGGAAPGAPGAPAASGAAPSAGPARARPPAAAPRAPPRAAAARPRRRVRLSPPLPSPPPPPPPPPPGRRRPPPAPGGRRPRARRPPPRRPPPPPRRPRGGRPRPPPPAPPPPGRGPPRGPRPRCPP